MQTCYYNILKCDRNNCFFMLHYTRRRSSRRQVNVLQDVLILRQFIRANGEVLPQHATGLCYKAHLRLQRVVRQAQLAGVKRSLLKPNKNVVFSIPYFKKNRRNILRSLRCS